MSKKPTTASRLTRLEEGKVGYHLFGAILILLILWNLYLIEGDALNLNEVRADLESLERDFQDRFDWECVETEVHRVVPVTVTSPTIRCGRDRCVEEGAWTQSTGEPYNMSICTRKQLTLKNITEDVWELI